MPDPTTLFPTGLLGIKGTSLEGASQPRDRLGQNEFFELMIAQLKHQDPLKPLENADLIAQVAQFSTVNGIQEIQKSMQSLAGSFQSAQALQASTLVGRTVLVGSDRVVLAPGETVSGAVDLDTAVSDLTIYLATPDGAQVRSLSLGPQPAGRVSFTWDGINEKGQLAPPGRYAVRAEVLRDTQTIAVPTLLQGKVESVTLNRQPGELTLNVRHQGEVQLHDIAELL